MLFNSFDYVLFLAIVFVLYWGLEPRSTPIAKRIAAGQPKRIGTFAAARVSLLLAASWLFYMSWNSVFIVLIIGSTLVDYLIGLALGRTEREPLRKLLVGLSLLANLGLLGLFKYADFVMVAASDVAGLFGVSYQPTLMHLILPVGISFYTFQTLSYTIDVYRRRLEPTKNLLEFATYVAFFPQLVAGPIVRAAEFLPQFRRAPRLSAAQAQSGIYLILRGLVKKVVIADFLALRIIDRVFDNPSTFSAGEVWVAVYCYTWQLYGDFSGYTDIARGSARLLGFELPENFDRPFDTTGPLDFWRRWHMTLSRWVQDYLYVPLGGSKKGVLRSYFNLAAAFFIIGIWHGAGWTFVLFGVWHSAGVVANRLYLQWRKKRNGGVAPPPASGLTRAVLVFINLHFFILQWPVFRSPSIARMREVYDQMWNGDWLSLRVEPGIWVILFGMAFVHFCPRAWVDRAERGMKELPWPAFALLLIGVAALVMYVSAGQAAPFIYFQF